MRYTDSWWGGYADCMTDIIKAAKHLLVPKSMREALKTILDCVLMYRANAALEETKVELHGDECPDANEVSDPDE